MAEATTTLSLILQLWGALALLWLCFGPTALNKQKRTLNRQLHQLQLENKRLWDEFIRRIDLAIENTHMKWQK